MSVTSYNAASGVRPHTPTQTQLLIGIRIISFNLNKAWFDDKCEAIPGKTMPNFIEVERNYPELLHIRHQTKL